MPPMSPGTPIVQMVEITDIVGDVVEGLDYFGLTHKLPLNVRRGKGALPQVGDIWLIDRRNGDWTLGTCLQAASAVIEGDVVEGSPQDALLTALDELGFIDDQATRVDQPPPPEDAVPWAQWMNVRP